MKILVIEDEVSILELIKKVLTKEGYSVVTAEDYDTAIEIIRSEDLNLIITDLMLPFTGGYDIVDFVKKNPAKKHIPVILATGMNENILSNTHSGAQACLVKPFTSLQLKEVVRRNLLAVV